MSNEVEPSWLGRRVSVRRVVDRDPDGRLLLGDVVGELAGLDAQTAVLDARAGLVEVPLALVVAARLVLPSTADELALQRAAAAGWRAAQTQDLDGWLLRANDGFTKRAKIIKALGHPTRLFMVEELAKGERCVCELTEMVGRDKLAPKIGEL